MYMRNEYICCYIYLSFFQYDIHHQVYLMISTLHDLLWYMSSPNLATIDVCMSFPSYNDI